MLQIIKFVVVPSFTYIRYYMAQQKVMKNGQYIHAHSYIPFPYNITLLYECLPEQGDVIGGAYVCTCVQCVFHGDCNGKTVHTLHVH